MSKNTTAERPPELGRDAQEILLQVSGMRPTMRKPAPVEAAIPAALAELHRNGLITLGGETIEAVATEAGKSAAARIRAWREREAAGLPLELWRREHDPNKLTLEAFRRNGTDQCIGPDGWDYTSDGHLAIETRAEDSPQAMREIHAKTMFDDKEWSDRTVAPIGYLFDNDLAMIAFDAAGLLIDARYYEIILEATRDGRVWTAMAATPNNTRHHDPDPNRHQMIRVGTPERKRLAFVAACIVNRETPGIDKLMRARPGETPQG